MAKKAKPKKDPPVPNAAATEKVAASRRAPRIPVHLPVGGSKRTRELEEKFLDGLRNSWSVSKSAHDAGMDTATAYNWRSKSAATYDEVTETYGDDFCVRWEEARKVGIESLEDEAIRRAKHGVDKPVYQTGVLVGSITEYSDTLMGLVLRGKRPEVYNTERHEHTGKDGGDINMNINVQFVQSTNKK